MQGITIGIAVLSGSVAIAQDTEMQQHVAGAVALLEQLDALAGACNTSLQQPDAAAAEVTTGAVNQSPCSQFLAAVDGELLAQYLAHCSALKEWKSQYVTSTFEAKQSSTTPEIALQLLVGTDYACGEDALQKRTQFVTSTFALIQRSANNGAGISQRPNNPLDQRLKELQFDATLSAERNLLQNSVQQQEQQRAQESARQMRQIELENLRQQLNQ